MSEAHLALVGPTASGKTAVSVALALALSARGPAVEIVSADAMMVYAGTTIGTAAPTLEEQRGVPHHAIGFVDPSVESGLGLWLGEARRSVAAIEARGHRALVVGGTGMYVQALVDEWTLPGSFADVRAQLDADPRTAAELHAQLAALDPHAATKMEPSNRRRIVRALEVCLGSGQPFSSFGGGVDSYPANPRWHVAGLWPSLDVLDARIECRVAAEVEAGLVDELRALLSRPGGLSRTCRIALGYKELIPHIEDDAPLAECMAEDVANTKRFARRQRRWFRRDPRTYWIGGDAAPVVSAAVAADPVGVAVPKLVQAWAPQAG